MLIKNIKENFQDSSWWDFFKEEINKDYFINLNNLYTNSKDTLFPEYENIFRVFKLCSLEDIKVLIFGQDPYHTPGVADGIAFSTKNKKCPPSLKNIFKELELEYKKEKTNTDLTSWVEQGVFLINTLLTVKQGIAMSCKDWGWETFINNFLDYIYDQEIIFVLLGNKALSYKDKINKKNIILNFSHPSPFSAYKSFINSDLFKKINKLLEKPIEWF